MTEPASADCEVIRDVIGQPINAISSLAFIAVALVLARRRPVLAAASGAVGLGSVLFHGPMPAWAEWAHDTSLAMLALALMLEAKPGLWLGGSAVIAALFAVAPRSAEVTTAVLAVVAVVVVVRRSARALIPVLPLLGIGVVFAVLSRTGAPLCDPASLLQGHAAWHVLGAAALWVWARSEESTEPVAETDHR
ncbi:MAG: hypothetical protein QNJ75_12425 [Acidimicrobiia bacterium]|nr:hypothetical protein [Acidimicrobiia bacterium]